MAVLLMLLLFVKTNGLVPFTFVSNEYYDTKLHWFRGRSSSSLMAKLGIFYGTSTGSTGEAAEMIAEELESLSVDVGEPMDVDSISASDISKLFKEYNALIVGTPTWNTDADTERSGTGWDELYYTEMKNLEIKGKKVAVFGLGDSVSYAENYADATGELHDVLQNLGCVMLGYTPQDGYLHKKSKSIRDGKFCGLLLDAVNQESLTGDRIKRWVKQIIDEGMLEDGGPQIHTKTESLANNVPIVHSKTNDEPSAMHVQVPVANSKTNDDPSAMHVQVQTIEDAKKR